MNIRKFLKPGHLFTVVLLASAAGSITAARAQEAFEVPLGIAGAGIRVSSVSAWGQFFSSGLPTTSTNSYGGRLPDLGGDEGYGFSTKLASRFSTGPTTFSMLYEPSYTGRVRFTQWNAFNQHLGIHVNHQFSARFHTYLSIEGAQQTLDQFLFEPTDTGRLPGGTHTFDELVKELLAGKITEAQFSALLTGEHPVSPVQTLLYGNRLSSIGVHNGYAYQFSPRVDVSFGLSGIHVEHTRNFQDAQHTPLQFHLIPRSTSYSGRTALGYTFTPRTRLELSVSESRSLSSFQNFNILSGVARFSTQIGTHWLVHLGGGGGTLRPILNVKTGFERGNGIRYLANGGLAYKTLTQLYMLSSDKSISEETGFGANRLVTSGSWNWRQPGQPWGLLSSVSKEDLNRANFIKLNAWLVRGGVSRALNRNFQLNLEYAYLSNHSRFQNLLNDVARNSARIALVWNGTQNSPYGGGVY